MVLLGNKYKFHGSAYQYREIDTYAPSTLSLPPVFRGQRKGALGLHGLKNRRC